jgi:phosphoglycolate phosphatase
MSWDIILFDLDGTLTDPKVGITTCAAYGLNQFGIEVEDLDTLTKFIGPPLIDSYMEYYGLTRQQAEQAIVKYRERYGEVGWSENIPYTGIHELCAKLKAAGKKLLVATSKPEGPAVRIMEHFGLAQYFDIIGGAPLDNSERGRKAAVIEDTLKRAGVTDLSRCVMVGDRLHDIHGAHEVGMPVIGVLYGYGDRAEHEEHGADYIAADLAELETLLLGC